MIETLKVVFSSMFMIAGMAKLFRAKPLQEQFDEFGLSNYFILIVGGMEILGAIGLQIKPLELLSALGLATLMIGAIYQHIKVKHQLVKSVPSGVIFLLLTIYIILTIDTI